MTTAMNFYVVLIMTTLYLQINAVEKFTRPVAFCGANLSKALSQYCTAYYSPPGHRKKRQIIQECCYNKCSLKYLLENYCESVNTEAYEKAVSERAAKEPSLEDMISTRLNKRKRRTFISYNEINIESNKNTNNAKLKTHKKKRKKRNKSTCERKKQRLLENLRRSRGPVPEPRIGVVEDDTMPFYVHISQEK